MSEINNSGSGEGVPIRALSFSDLRSANAERVTHFKDARGRISHENVNDWSPADWLMAVTGELGELANLLKKVHRGDFEQEDVQQEIADELADVAIYLDLLALRLGVRLDKAIVRKFNVVSERVDSPVRLP
jgi:NTP pyrophosphatase (non-canonical NTP hydrolase)